MTLSQRIVEALQSVGADIKDLLTGKQDALVAGQNIKTINGQSLLGLGDLSISSGGSMPDVLDLTTVDEPASPPSGHLSVYAKSLGGRAMLAQKCASGISTVYQPHLGRNYCQVITSNGSTGVLGYGCAVSSSGGTAAAWTPTANLGVGTKYSNTVAAATSVSIYPNALSFYRAAAGSTGGFHFFARVGFPDASYDGTAASTGSRIFAGMTAGATASLTSADVLAAIAVGFRRVHNFSGVHHANWVFSSRNNTTETQSDTGLAFFAGHQYTFAIFAPVGATSVTWEIENVTTGDVATGVATDTLPELMTRMRPVASVGTINAVARSMWFQSLYAEADF